ncbi:MAG: hypothetical protein NE327_06220, partial [Lentisphaeraceae bacterium]|nr:hypothetical protein [Lentisphaeraceae bacterium]
SKFSDAVVPFGKNEAGRVDSEHGVIIPVEKQHKLNPLLQHPVVINLFSMRRPESFLLEKETRTTKLTFTWLIRQFMTTRLTKLQL